MEARGCGVARRGNGRGVTTGPLTGQNDPRELGRLGGPGQLVGGQRPAAI